MMHMPAIRTSPSPSSSSHARNRIILLVLGLFALYGAGLGVRRALVEGQYSIMGRDMPFTLESAPAVLGPWSSQPGAASPLTVLLTNNARFFRLRNYP